MEGQNHLCEMQRYVANVAITPSTFRKLGAGFVEAAQEFLASLNLKQLANLEPSEYPKWLEDQTQALLASFPLAERWGPARKSINIFMVMASLNQFLCDEYKLGPLWLCARSATGQYCHKEVACVGKGEKSCAPRAVPDIQY